MSSTAAHIDDASPPPSEAKEVAWPRPIYAWYAVFILLLAYAIATLDRVVIGLLVESIQSDLGLDDTSISLLIGLAFALFYTLFGLPIGMLVDRRRRVSILSAGIVMFSAATAACGLAKGFVGLFLARIFVGIGEATVTPSSSSIIADYFPPERRAKAFGVLMLGGSLGTSLAYLLGSFAIHISSWLQNQKGILEGVRDWQLVFFMTGGTGILLAILMALTLREPVRRETGNIAEKEKAKLGEIVRELIDAVRAQKLAYLAVIGGAVMNVFLISAQLSWYPSLFIRVFHVPPAQIGGMLAMVGFPAGVFSAISGGFIMAWLAKRGRTDGPLIIMLAQAVIWGGLGVAKCLAPSVTASLSFHFVTSLTANWGVPAAMVGITQITRNRLRGQMTGLYSLIVGLVAVTLGPLAVGVLSDNLYTDRAGLAYSLATVYALGGTAGITMILVGWKAFVAASDRSSAAFRS